MMGVPYRDSMPFTIRDVLDNLGLPVKAEKRGVLILDCPFCLGKNGQPDRHGHSPPFPPPQSHCSQRRSCRRASSIRAA